RMTRQTSPRNRIVTSSSPSSWRRNTHFSTPSASAAARCSRSRVRATCAGVALRSWLPLLPLVSRQYTTELPAAVHCATVPLQPKSASSGCANTTNARGGISNVIGMRNGAEPGRLAPAPARSALLRDAGARRREQLGVDVFDAVGDAIPGERDGARASSGGELDAQLHVVEQAFDGVRQGFGISGRDEHPALAGDDGLQSTNPCRDYRRSAGHRLERDQTEA